MVPKQVIFGTLLFLLFVSCKTTQEENSAVSPSGSVPKGYVTATIKQIALDGCNWMLVLENQQQLEPVNLADSLKINELPVLVNYVPAPGPSICMAGQRIRIIDIKKKLK